METTNTEMTVQRFNPNGETGTPISVVDDVLKEMKGNRCGIAGDRVCQATEHLPLREKAAIRWMHAYQHDNNLTHREAAVCLLKPNGNGQHYDHATWYDAMTRPRGDLSNIVTAIEYFQHKLETAPQEQSRFFVETSLTRKIAQACELARKFKRLVFLVGESQSGKTEGLLAYKRSRPFGQVHYFRLPAGGNLGKLYVRMAKELRINQHRRGSDLNERLMDAISPDSLPIFDEFHQIFLNNMGRLKDNSCKVLTAEFIREIVDDRRSGGVICGTRVFLEEMEDDMRFGKILRQMRLRGFRPIILPSVPPAVDMQAAAAHFGLAPANGSALKLQEEIGQEFGFGQWTILLQAAAEMATKERTKMTWQHVIRTDAGFRKLEGSLQTANGGAK